MAPTTDERLRAAISLCRKAGRLRCGGDVVRQAAASGQADLVLLSADVAGRSARQTQAACQAGGVPLRQLPLTMEQLSQVTGKTYGILAVCDQGFAAMIQKLLQENPT